MAGETFSANMSLPIPGVGVTDGPQFATDINNALTIIDQHDHSIGSGVQITPSGLNINAALPMNNQLLSLPSAVNFQVQVTDPLANSIYSKGVDLYYIDGSSNVIRITQSGSVSGSSGTITGLPSGTASAAYGAGVFVFQSATNTAASVDGRSFILRNSTASSFGLTLQPPNAMAANYSVTLPAIPAQTNVMTLDTSGNMGSITYNAVGQGMSSLGANAIQASTSRTVSDTVGTGGVAISAVASFGVSTGPPTQVPGVSITITTSGRPVVVELQAANGGSSVSNLTINTSDATVLTKSANVIVVQNGSLRVFTQNAVAAIATSFNNANFPSSSFRGIDFVPSGNPGTYTYTLFLEAVTGNTTVSINNVVLVAYEM